METNTNVLSQDKDKIGVVTSVYMMLQKKCLEKERKNIFNAFCVDW